MRRKLEELLRVGRFQGWDSRKMADEVLKLLGVEVDDQPATPDQLPGPPANG